MTLRLIYALHIPPSSILAPARPPLSPLFPYTTLFRSPPRARRRGDRAGCGHPQQPRRSRRGAPAARRPRRLASARVRPRGGRGESEDVGQADRVQRGAGAMTSTDWFEVVLIILLIAAVGVLGASEVAITRA